jgi:predicted ArsR family transcriptional regulator
VDTCCEVIAKLLCQDGQSSPRSLAKLVEKSGMARSSIMMHLKHLEGQSLILKEEILRGSVGRPKTLYKPSPKLLENINQTKSD